MRISELKNLSPHLYSATEYCEKSYIHSEQKQMVLDNLKDYALQALVNAVDHLWDCCIQTDSLLEQQTTEFDTMNLKVACLNQAVDERNKAELREESVLITETKGRM